jgi:hypothetical protein
LISRKGAVGFDLKTQPTQKGAMVASSMGVIGMHFSIISFHVGKQRKRKLASG